MMHEKSRPTGDSDGFQKINATAGTIVSDPAQGARAEMLTAALGYAAAGWRVHPCRRDKTPLTTWSRDATTDPQVITAWWRRWPWANVAVVTGAPGPDVLDVDVKAGRGGLELFERARRAGLLRGAAAIVRTPSGGLHIWFTGSDQRGGAVGRDRALELKAVGGYVLVPPSQTDAGRYELVEWRPSAGRIDWAAVRRLLDPPRPTRWVASPQAGADVGRLARWLAKQPEGNRNRATYWAACQALKAGADDLGELVAAAIATGLPEREVRRTIESARRRIRGAA